MGYVNSLEGISVPFKKSMKNIPMLRRNQVPPPQCRELVGLPQGEPPRPRPMMGFSTFNVPSTVYSIIFFQRRFALKCWNMSQKCLEVDIQYP